MATRETPGKLFQLADWAGKEYNASIMRANMHAGITYTSVKAIRGLKIDGNVA